MRPPKRGVLVAHQDMPQLWTVTNQNKVVGHVRYVEDFPDSRRSELDAVMHQQGWPPLGDNPEQVSQHRPCQSVHEHLGHLVCAGWEWRKLLLIVTERHIQTRRYRL